MAARNGPGIPFAAALAASVLMLSSASCGGGGSSSPGPSGWTQKVPSGDPNAPPPRSNVGFVWTGSNRAVFFGGFDGSAQLNDLWWYDPSSNHWTSKIGGGQPSSPGPRNSVPLVWDGTRVILFGGQVTGPSNDLWWYDPGANAWTRKIVAGAASSPPARYSHSLVWDGTRVILFGGFDVSRSYNDVWWYDPGTNAWTQKIALDLPSSPGPRNGGSLVWDGTRAILFGGGNPLPGSNDLWWYDPGANAWTQKIFQGASGSPPSRSHHGAAWDGASMLVFGGAIAGGQSTNDLWAYSSATNTWAELTTNAASGSPSSRIAPGMIHDGTRTILASTDTWWYAP